jgi:hypothetical protein
MATQQEKIYRISIQTDAAQQEVEATKKKLAELDGQLEGLDMAGDAAKGLIAEMAKLTQQLSSAEGEVKDLAGALDDLKPGTLGALESEIEELEAAFRRTVVGTAEFDEALIKLGNKKGELKKIEDAIDALDPKEKAAAFADFANGVVGAFAIATTAAQTFGLSKEAAEEYQTKLLSLISVMDGVEQVSKALNSETLSVVKSTYAGAKAWLGFGEAASASSKITRAALISTGIGAIVVLVGLLVANFDKVKEVGSSIYAKFKPQFDGIAALIDVVINKARDVASFLTFGLVDNAAKHAQAVAVETRQKELSQQAEHTARLIEIFKARGQDTLDLEVANAKRRLDSLKQTNDEEKKAYAEARKDYLVLAAQLEKRGQDEEKASRLTHLNALAAIQQAKGADAFAQQLAAKKEQQAQLAQDELNGIRVTEAQKEQLQSEIDAAQLAHDAQQAEKRRALREAYLVADLARLQASTADQSNIEVAANTKQIEIAKQHRANLLAQALVDRAAVVAADAELYRLRQERARLYYKEEAEIEASILDIRARAFEAMRKKDAAAEQFYQDTLNRMQAAGAQVTKRIADELAAELLLKQMAAAAKADVFGNLLMRVFGLSDKQAQELKAQLADFATVAGGLVTGLLATAQASADAQLSQAQAQLQSVTDQLAQAQSAAEATAAQLEGASGARRDYLLKKLQDERAETDRLAAAKAKAAKAEQDAEKQKQKLAKESAALSAAAGLASTVATGAKAVEAAVGVIAGGSKLPFPASLVAVATGLAFVTTAVLQAKQLAKSFRTGGYVEGPSHEAGGVQMWHRSGAHLGEMEGGEFIFSRAAVAAHGLPFLQALNDSASTYVKPHPSGRFAAGGQVPTAGSLPAGAVVMQAGDLAELLDTNRAMLAHLQVVSSATSTTASYGPASLQIGPGEAMAIEGQRQQAIQAEGLATL